MYVVDAGPGDQAANVVKQVGTFGVVGAEEIVLGVDVDQDRAVSSTQEPCHVADLKSWRQQSLKVTIALITDRL